MEGGPDPSASERYLICKYRVPQAHTTMRSKLIPQIGKSEGFPKLIESLAYIGAFADLCKSSSI